MLRVNGRDVRVCNCHDMEDKVSGLTIESRHGRKPKRNIVLSLTKEAEILKVEALSFRRLCISWGSKLVVCAIYWRTNEESEWLENSFIDVKKKSLMIHCWGIQCFAIGLLKVLIKEKKWQSQARLLFCFSDLPLRCSQLTFCIRQPLEQASHNQMCHPIFYGSEIRKDNLILNHLWSAKNSWQFDPFYPWLLFSPMTKGK